MFFRVKRSQGREYLQIVENRREDGRVKQRVIATLGRLEPLKASGQLDALLQSGARLAESVLLVLAQAKGDLTEVRARRIGAVKISERLWQETAVNNEAELGEYCRKRGPPCVRLPVFVKLLVASTGLVTSSLTPISAQPSSAS